MQNVNAILRDHPLARLITKEAFIGWVYSIDYDIAKVMTNDLWKEQAHGVPHNSFLVAATFDPDDFAATRAHEQEVILLRVVGSSKLPQDDDLVRTKISHFQQRTDAFVTSSDRDYDDITRNQLQFGGLECRVLGTFYVREDTLCLGSDLESFATAASLNVYRPQGSALSTIVNYVDPVRRKKAEEDAALLGIEKPVQPFPIGTVRYTSTDRLHRAGDVEKVKVYVQPSDFLARRTAVLGMTRTGKSNLIKQMVSVVKRVADEGGVKIGQIIYDINGEYANANQQDSGAIADVYPHDTVRYRMLKPPAGFQELRNNFYQQLSEGFNVIKRELEEAGRATSDYVRSFVNMSLDEPDTREHGEHARWERRVAAYRTLLFKAGFAPPEGYAVKFKANETVRQAVNGQSGDPLPDPEKGLTLPQAADWFERLRSANNVTPLQSTGTSGKLWVDDTLSNLLDMICQKNKGTNNFISGYSILADSVKYHSPQRTSDVAKDIYGQLTDGKIVILDLSVGDPNLRERLSKDVASRIFHDSMMKFVGAEMPPNIVVYIEEAHNLIGKQLDLTETWPRLAKEGAKYRIGLVYATQEVSSVHPNILSNTENWFISHLNNEREVKELAQFYDFADFGRSLIRAQDVGFARVKTLSGPFVVPVQVDRFMPNSPAPAESKAATHARSTTSSSHHNLGAYRPARAKPRSQEQAPEYSDEHEQAQQSSSLWTYVSRVVWVLGEAHGWTHYKDVDC